MLRLWRENTAYRSDAVWIFDSPTLLISNGKNVQVAQSQLRHTNPKTTLELYAQAVSADQQEAHKKVVQMVLPAGFPEKLRARGVTATV